MKNIIPYSSSSSFSSSEEQSKKDLEKEEEEMMAVEQYDQSKRISSSSMTPNSNIALDPNDGYTRCRKKRAFIGQNKARSCAMERAEEVKANLEPQFPSFVKSMRPSHVSGEFRLGIPAHFGEHLPKQIAMMKLIDEEEKDFSVKYLPSKIAFSLGWKDFCIAHNLVDGDAVVFQLVKSTEFQVYIIRAYSVAEVEGITALQNLDAHHKQIQSFRGNKTSEKTVGRGQKTLALVSLQLPKGSRSRSDSEDVDSEVMEGIRFSKPRLEFKDIKTLEMFTIAVNDLIIDSEFSEQARSKYYELCCSQKAFLHENLLGTINCELAAALISQTISIADSIRASTLTTSQDKFVAWDTTLGAFEQLGMNVVFLRAKIKKLVRLVHESVEGVDSKRYREAIAERDNMKEEIRTLKSKLVELKEASQKLDNEIGALTMNLEHHELQFQAEVDAPW